VKIRYDFDENKKVDPIINVNLEYPEIAAELGVQGIVKLSFKTNSDCSVTDFNVISGLGHGCDKSAIKSVKKMANLSLKYRPNDACDVSTKIVDFTFTLK
jgi:outer membrane biosynthesis protein TonB